MYNACPTTATLTYCTICRASPNCLCQMSVVFLDLEKCKQKDRIHTYPLINQDICDKSKSAQDVSKTWM